MRSIPPLMAFAGAVVVFAAGYAQGAASGTANPFLNTKFMATSGLTFVEGPDAEPPPWPSNVPAARPSPAHPAIAAAAPASSTSPTAAESHADTAPADTERVVPADRSDVMAMNIPSSALNPIANPPPAPAAETAAPQEVQKTRPRAKRTVPKTVTFGTTREGRPVTIIWDR